MKFKKTNFTVPSFFLFSLLALMCKDKGTEAPPQLDKLVVGQWNNIGFQNTGDTTVYIGVGDSILLTITDTGHILGYEICNYRRCNPYFATYKIGPNKSFLLDSLGSKQLACFPISCEVYWDRYIDSLLPAVKSFDVDTTLLYLFYGAGKGKLIFMKN